MFRPQVHSPFLLSVALAAFIACGSEDAPQGPGDSANPKGGAATGGGQNSGTDPDGTTDIEFMPMDGMGGADNSDPQTKITIEETLPAGFTAADAWGGWKVLGPIEDYEAPESNSCANVLRLIIRDFAHDHADFGSLKPASFNQDMVDGLYQGHVLPLLDKDTGKPQINPDRQPADLIESLSDWYTNVEGVNTPYVMDLWLQPDPNQEGVFVFDSSAFFPLDGAPYIEPANEVYGHNFGFTTELRTAFEYQGGEVFTFRGDDDVFVFIDGKLAVDIGGIHNAHEETLELDAQAAALGLQKGEIYSLVLFQAERNPGASNYRIETSLDFRSCEILPDDIIVK